MTSTRRTNRSARIIIHQHGLLPILTDRRLIFTHIAIPRPRISTNLDVTPPSVGHCLRGLAAADVQGRLPQSLREVCVVGVWPRLLAFEPPTAYVLDVVLLPPFARASILGEVLALGNSRLVLDSILVAIVEQSSGPALGMLGEGEVPNLRSVLGSEPFVILLTAPIVAFQIRSVALVHLAVSGVIPHDDLVLLVRTP